ncbi:hypothetical protein CK203_028024 [Vitis vinifera]|uniref:Uncharacterized protein n=1 Tax=Vitis vinifera TaxID=29760 RepID=A0A438FRJ2_VITVI|nr:hypothetical protein CK203_063159 [Vitis vinifera]RVW97768.1 hypothetical protein CK203_028024 [Vitis vinifera]
MEWGYGRQLEMVGRLSKLKHVSSWNPRFFGQLNDWELEEVDNFFGMLHDQSLSLDFVDILVWVDTKNGVFSVKSYSLASRGAAPFPHGTV